MLYVVLPDTGSENLSCDITFFKSDLIPVLEYNGMNNIHLILA